MDAKCRGRMGRYGEDGCRGLWELLEPLARLWGVATAVVMCGVGVEMAVHRHIAGIYIVLGSIVVFFLEIMWAITLFIDLCTNPNEYTSLLRCWDAVTCCRGWRRVPPYVAGGLALLLLPRLIWLARAAGAQLLGLAALHAALQARPSRRPLLPDQHHHLVTDAASECGGDRYDDLTEVLDDTFPAAVSSNHQSMGASPSVRDQEAILEI